MFNFSCPETELASDWLNGLVANEALGVPVVAARAALQPLLSALAHNPRARLPSAAKAEARARCIWDWLEAVFNIWKFKHGTEPRPPATPRGALAKLQARWRWSGVKVEDIPAYEWASVGSYAELLNRLLNEKHPVMVGRLNKLGLPLPKLWAVVILKEASEGHIDAALRAYSLMEDADKHELLAKWGDNIKRMRPFVQTGIKIKKAATEGHKKVHGTPEQKKARWDILQAEVNKLRTANPKWSKSEIRRRAANKNLPGWSETSIKRHTRDSGRKNS